MVLDEHSVVLVDVESDFGFFSMTTFIKCIKSPRDYCHVVILCKNCVRIVIIVTSNLFARPDKA